MSTAPPDAVPFANAVRDGTVGAPDRPGFRRAAWTAAFDASPPAPEVTALFEAGLVVDTHLSAIRAQLAGLGGLPTDRAGGVRLFVALVNREGLVSSRLLQREVGSRLATADDPLMFPFDLSRPLRDAWGTQVGVDEVIEAAVDGAEFPLRFLLTGRLPLDEPCRDEDRFRPVRIGYRMILLGQMYGRVEKLWRACVAGRVRVASTPESDVYDETDERGRRRALAAFRREALGLEAASLSASVPLAGVDLVDGRPPKGVEALGTGRARTTRPVRVRSGHRSAGLGEIERMLVGRVAHPNRHLDSLAGLQLPEYGGLTVGGMLRVWDALQVMASRLVDGLPADETVRGLGDLDGFAPSVSERSLRSSLGRATGLPPRRVAAALGALTFTGGRGETLWFRPLVRASEDELVPVLFPLVGPNVNWLTEHWLQEGGVDLGRRGALFEEEVLADVQRAVLSGPLADAECHPTTLTLTGQGVDGRTTEEIDLVVRVNGHVLVGEVKCRLYPSDDPNGWTSLAKTIREGSEQARRKALFVAANREALLAATGWDPAALPSPVPVVPVVVVNLPDGAGMTETDVPVVDSSILAQFFSPGHLRVNVRRRGRGPAYGGETIPFYGDDTSAGAALGAYLLDPPQLAVYRPHLRVEDYPISINGAPRPTFERVWVVDAGRPPSETE